MKAGWEQVVAVLAVLYSGAAYLPVDPSLPTARFRYLLEDGEVGIALTQPALQSGLAWPESVQVFCVDRSDKFDTESFAVLTPMQGPEDLAYVIFTSGSTGQPKGVMIDHRGVVNTILDINKRFKVCPSDKVLALSSLSFDLSVYDIFGTLAAGGTIVIPEASALRDPAHWQDLIIGEGVTVWNSVPALMTMLVDFEAGRRDAKSWPLRLVMLSGDWIPVALPKRIKELAPEAEVISLGGATEASIWSIHYPIDRVDPAWKSIPYGRPLMNQRFYVLNKHLEPCPAWVPGNLYIAGVGLARGYWKDKEKTEAVFLSHPRSGERLYHTRDLGCYLPDGNIEFLGRDDHQVKIRGYRIELGEIETTLLTHDAVQAAVVVATGASAYDKRLVAYVVPNQPVNGVGNKTGEIKIEDLTMPGDVLLDPAKRRIFAFENHNILPTASEQLSIYLDRVENDADLERTYKMRRSERRFSPAIIPFRAFSQILAGLMPLEIDGWRKYRYASAGSLYPVQSFVYIKENRVADVLPGFYYYHPLDHRLVLINPKARLDRYIHAPVNQQLFDDSAFSIFLIGQQKAIAPMYGPAARDFCLLEAGYISQLLMTLAPEVNLGLCPIGALNFQKIQELLALEESQLFLHCLVGGPPAEDDIRLKLPSQQVHSAHTGSNSELSDGKRDLGQHLQDFLTEKLPDYMRPSSIVVLDSLPLTSEGKVNRLALANSAVVPSKRQTSFLAPRTELQRQVAQIIKDVTGVETVGIQDNFFDLGSNSMQLVQVHHRLREVIDHDFQVVDLFRHPTIEALLMSIEQGAQDEVVKQAQDRSAIRKQALSRRQSRNSVGEHNEGQNPRRDG